VVLWYRERSGIVQLAVYCGAVWYCGTEIVLLVCISCCIVELCGIVVQRAVCYCADGRVLWSDMVFRYKDRSFSVQLAVYCGAVWYCGTEMCLLVCRWRCIVERCEAAV
jgi:hypothetical protein